jgi:rhodanese-related sulfurtransferase
MGVTFTALTSKGLKHQPTVYHGVRSFMPRNLFKSRRLVLATAAIGVLSGSAGATNKPMRRGLPDPTDPGTSLACVERSVAELLAVPEMTPAELSLRIEMGEPLTLFDVRQPDEYAQSRLPNATLLTPETPVRAVLKQLRSRQPDAKFVFYCSVGWRSGRLVQEIRQATRRMAGPPVFNLRGGIFRWYDEDRELEFGPDASGVHPFTRNWGTLLSRLD